MTDCLPFIFAFFANAYYYRNSDITDTKVCVYVRVCVGGGDSKLHGIL